MQVITSLREENNPGHRVKVKKGMTLSSLDWVARTKEGKEEIAFPQRLPEEKFEGT